MRKGMRKLAALAVMAAAVTFLCAGCSEKPDPEAYVKAALDAIYHRECGAYADMLHVSEAQAEEEIEKTFQGNMETAFSGDINTSDADREAYIDAVREIYKLARYEVTDSEEKEDGFAVTVCVEPCIVFENLEEGVTEKMTQALENGSYTEEKTVSYITEYLNEALEENEYGEKTDIEVNVTMNKEGVWQISEDDLLKLEDALFPGVMS